MFSKVIYCSTSACYIHCYPLRSRITRRKPTSHSPPPQAALEPFTSLTKASSTDNFLLELSLALELSHPTREPPLKILPLWVGPLEPTSDESIYVDFFDKKARRRGVEL